VAYRTLSTSQRQVAYQGINGHRRAEPETLKMTHFGSRAVLVCRDAQASPSMVSSFTEGRFMRRRDFISALGVAVTWPLTAQAQQGGRLPIIGFLGAASQTVWSDWVSAFVERFNQLGWTEGRTVHMEFRWAEGRQDRYSEIAKEFVALNAAVIVTSGGAVSAVQAVTSTIPIVFSVANNPVEAGLVASLARPAGNTTGLSSQQPDLVGKRIELLRDLKPDMARLAILSSADYLASKQEMLEAETAAHTLGLDVVSLAVKRGDDIVPAFRGLKSAVDAVYISANPLMAAQIMRIVTLMEYLRLPSVSGEGDFAASGGTLGYGADIPDLFRRSANIVDKILHGAKPADIPVEQPTKFDLVINARAARAIGVEVPATLLAIADKVIE
jgi:putative tryptophan/tyrosine transport system substrate-binding protein